MANTLPKAPYLIVGFDVDRGHPNCDEIMTDVEDNFPMVGTPLDAAVNNMHIIEVPPSQMTARLRELIAYFMLKDGEHGGAVRWVAQLCRAPEIGVG
jgi:hypothetical protein